jgi:hypothetical protein
MTMNTRQFVSWALIGLVLLAGCAVPEGKEVVVTPPDADAAATPTSTPPVIDAAVPSTATAATPPKASATPAPTATPTATTTPTAAPTAMPTATPTATLPAIAPAVCGLDPVIHELDTLLGVSDVAALEFLDADTLQVSGWRPRSAYGNPSDLRYPAYIFDRTNIDLTTGAMTPAMLPPERLLQQPCSECSGTYLLDESSDGGWQLVATTAGEGAGIWLVNAGTMTRLMLNMPTSLRWTWAADSSRLWLTYYTPEYSVTPVGHYLMAVELGATPTVATSADWSVPQLDSGQYGLSFSPTGQQILAVAGSGYDGSWDERFFLFDAAVTPPILIAQSGPIAGLRSAVWDEALGRFLLIVAGEDTVEFQTMDGAVVAELAAAALRSINPLVADEALTHFVQTHVPHALSPNRERVTLGYGSYGRTLAVFDCVVRD